MRVIVTALVVLGIIAVLGVYLGNSPAAIADVCEKNPAACQ